MSLISRLAMQLLSHLQGKGWLFQRRGNTTYSEGHNNKHKTNFAVIRITDMQFQRLGVEINDGGGNK